MASKNNRDGNKPEDMQQILPDIEELKKLMNEEGKDEFNHSDE